ncbi:MAG: ABC transporter substrate-binding protein [Lachnospiraceae bacterium]|nr:ABC transporter substrate-binding protein [Lachnospiraceae bacterium]
MKKRVVSVLLAAVMTASVLAGCGSSGDTAKEEKPAEQEQTAATETGQSEEKAESTESAESTGDVQTLEFYHGYYHDESEWPAAKVMRDIYDDFAAAHADGPVVFKPIPVENRGEIVSAQVAGGNFPDVVDVDQSVPQAAISQGLVLDLKPFIDENGLQDAVGLNYTQNQVDGHIYTVHDQLESRGMWYNGAVLESAGVKAEDIKSWDDFGSAMDKVNALGDGSYGYIAGQGSLFMMNAMMASSDTGKALIEGALTQEAIESAEFAEAFKAAAALDQKNGSDHTTDNIGNLMDDFNKKGTVAALFNGVWNASGIDASLAESIQPALFPGNTAIASAGGGISISSNMDEAKTELALEFLAYMVSPEVQERIFVGVQAAPCNAMVDLQALALSGENQDAMLVKLAEACSQVNNADTVVINLSYTWGGDVGNAIINAFMECAVSGADIDARFEQLKQELTALIA